MSEDKKIAEQMVRADAKRMLRQLRSMSTPTGVADYSSIADADIDNRTFVQLTIGVRGQLTRRNARDAAKMFREIVRRAPLAPVYPNFLGYDDDPRELWEIEEVRRHVCTWARFAKIRDAKDVLENCGEWCVGFLATCGVPAAGVEVVLPPRTVAQ
jgi:hypothetical protein